MATSGDRLIRISWPQTVKSSGLGRDDDRTGGHSTLNDQSHAIFNLNYCRVALLTAKYEQQSRALVQRKLHRDHAVAQVPTEPQLL